MDIYRKPTDSCNFLNYHSCHPKHTRDNIALSLAKRIVRIVSLDRDTRLEELKEHLFLCGHPEKTINYAFSKVYNVKEASEGNHAICFTSTHNPSRLYNSRTIKNILTGVKSDSMKKAFSDHAVILGTRQSKNLRNLLIKSRFSSQPQQPTFRPPSGLYKCTSSCIYHNTGYISECESFRFGRHLQHQWFYKRLFDCNSINVIYILTCNHCWKFYIGETGNFKERVGAHKSNALHPENANCKKLSYHLNKYSTLVEPYFHIYPMYYVDDQPKRRFIEKPLAH